MNYQEFIGTKLAAVSPVGLSGPFVLPESLFPHQVDLVTWALKRGRAAIFADTGLGKTRMELAWAQEISKIGDVLILAPLAVAAQTVAEGAQLGIKVTLCREPEDVQPGINIINYDRVHKLDASRFAGVVLDESSIIKHSNSKTFSRLTAQFKKTPYKLCATATPAPNDWTELGTHAEFFGICTQQEMLAEFFTHDGGDTSVWRLKGHAQKVFWQWVVSWGAMVRRPSDLGHDDAGYALPPLNITDHTVDIEIAPLDGMLFGLDAQTLSERRAARKQSLADRVAKAAEMVNAMDGPCIVWCDLNDESKALKDAIHGSVEITGADDVDVKEKRLADFAQGNIRVLISKPSICGWGLNWQHCTQMVFVGVTDSYEAFYQAVRRCWRFGQTKPVYVHVIASSAEGAIVQNLKRKENIAKDMAESLTKETRQAIEQEIIGARRETNIYGASKAVKVPSFLE